MKILFLSQGETINSHPGWHDALNRLKEEGEIKDFTNIPYLGFAKKHGWDDFYAKVVDLAKERSFDIVYFHYFHKEGKPTPRGCIERLLKLKNRPIVVTSVGDGFSDNWMWPDYPDDFKEASKLADITFSTQMGKAADKMKKWGANNVVYAPNSMCQVRFQAQAVDPTEHQFDFDVVMVGSKNTSRNILSKNWWGGRTRNKIIQALVEKYGDRFGLFGKGWHESISQGPIPFDRQQEAFRRGRIVVGGNPYSYADYYSSNRLFFEVSSGIPTVEMEVPRLSNILRDGDHCYFVKNVDGILEKCEDLLKADQQKLYKKAANAAKYVEENHTQYDRMKFKINTSKRYIKNDKELDVKFPFFLPEVDAEKEKKYTIR